MIQYFKHKKQYINPFIGFNDLWFQIIGIPVIGLLFPIVYFDFIQERSLMYFIISAAVSTGYALVIWQGNRQIVIATRKRFEQGRFQKNRIAITIVCAAIYSVVTPLLIDYFFTNESNSNWVEPKQLSTTAFCLLVSGFVLGIYESSYAYYKLNRSKLEVEQFKRTSAEAQLEALKNQIRPHFLFNSLNTLAALIPLNPAQAEAFVERLALVYRYILQINQSKTVTLQAELSFLESYIFLLKSRFEDNLIIKIDVEDASKSLIVPLATQLLVENAIKHNVVAQQQPLMVQIHQLPNGYLEVRNNLQPKKALKDSTYLGLKNIKEQYAFFTELPVKITPTNQHFIVQLPPIWP